MKRSVVLFCFLLGCWAKNPNDSIMNESVNDSNDEITLCNNYCTVCDPDVSDCEPVATECFDIESNSVPYICSPGDKLPANKSCFPATTVNSYEWCCCNTGTCVPN